MKRIRHLEYTEEIFRTEFPYRVPSSVDVWVFLSIVVLLLLIFALIPSRYSGSFSILGSSRPSNTITTLSWPGVWSRVEPFVAFTGVTFKQTLLVETEGVWVVADTFPVANRLSLVGIDSVVVVGRADPEVTTV